MRSSGAPASGSRVKRLSSVVRFLLWCWAFTIHVTRAKGFRVAALIPIAGIVLIIGALLSFAVGPFADVTGIKPDVSRALLVVGGIGLLLVTGWVSNRYNKQYPGKFNYRLEEYVARRVSRLNRRDFVPSFENDTPAVNQQRAALTHQVRSALKIELLRLKRTQLVTPTPLFGVIVVGPRGSHKTEALWTAMSKELKGWTFIRWPHHMDHAANLTTRMGQRIALWLYDLQDFANQGEATALLEFVSQLRAQGREVMVLGSVLSQDDLALARQYLKPLTDEPRKVSTRDVATLTDEQRDKLMSDYVGLGGAQKSVINSMNWLVSAGVHTFPYTVIESLSTFFQEQRQSNEEAQKVSAADIDRLSAATSRFTVSRSQVEAQRGLDERDKFLERMGYMTRRSLKRAWYRILRRSLGDNQVVMPFKFSYLDFKKVIKPDELDTIKRLNQNPEAIILALSGDPAAIETLILLGDSYLSPARANLPNAADLALMCYDDAYKALGGSTPSTMFPIAWVAALLGKANAELRRRSFSAALAEYQRIANETRIPIPKMVQARAWSGSGDAAYGIAAEEPNLLAPEDLQKAISYYKEALVRLQESDPLWGKCKLDEANALFELVDKATTEFVMNLRTSSVALPLTGDDELKRDDLLAQLDGAEKAYEEARRAYPRLSAPAVWAEIQRCIADIALRRISLHVPDTSVLLPQVENGVASRVDPATTIANSAEILKLARRARDACEGALMVFSLTYLPVSWARTHASLGRALLFIAPLIAVTPPDEPQALESYSACLRNAATVSRTIYGFSEAPLEWVDLQLLSAEAEIGRCVLDNAGPSAHLREAAAFVKAADDALDEFRHLEAVKPTDRMNDLGLRIKVLRRYASS
jgi:tetratricopeptide (TPR) repeat protein